ncbi:MAG: HAMP domain-containing sensor histidine kinase [Tahibacter sp.]
MSRLYLRFYFALLGSLVLFALITAVISHHFVGPVDRASRTLGKLIQNALPPADAPAAEQHEALLRLTHGLHANVVLVAAHHAPIAMVGDPLPIPDDAWQRGEWRQPWKDDTIWMTHLPDGRWLAASAPIGLARPAHALMVTLLALALAVAVGAYPIVRRLTKRLERLQRGVESLGAGDLSARVAVEGGDEVARLAESFNRAAARIESVVGAHKALLANASHELRTPLARIRMAIELMKETADARRKAGLDQDIAELDRLIDEILLSSRLDAVVDHEVDEDVDLYVLAAEECARYADVQLDGRSVQLRGDPRLLRRMLRNLLENAQRHGRPPIQVDITQRDASIALCVSDAGAPIPAEQRERLFEPFYRRQGGNDGGGAGLGLALVRQIARRHGGDAQCVALGDDRSGFVVELPMRH